MIGPAAVTQPRPDFDNPPVSEVALSVGFDPLAGYANAHSGLFWQRVSNTFTTVQEKQPLTLQLDSSPGPVVEFSSGAPPLRTWLVDRHESWLLQLQRDVFACNWRRWPAEQPYPRFEQVREQFETYFRSFVDFAKEQSLGDAVPTLCDVTYVNHVQVGDNPRTLGAIQEGFSPCAWPGMGFLPAPDQAGFTLGFVIRDAEGHVAGRLTADAKPAVSRGDNHPIFLLSMMARGKPLGTGVDGALAFFDLGREWIVRGFADLTTPKMHQLWGRTR